MRFFQELLGSKVGTITRWVNLNDELHLNQFLSGFRSLLINLVIVHTYILFKSHNCAVSSPILTLNYSKKRKTIEA